MRSYLYPSFALDDDNFEKAIPVAMNLSQEYNLPCRFLKKGQYYIIVFKDQAINQGFYYTHRHAEQLVSTLEKSADFQLVYSSEKSFIIGKELS